MQKNLHKKYSHKKQIQTNKINSEDYKGIAEFKRKSPFKEIRLDAEPEEIARLYEDCGASAISVLTDHHFDGRLEDLAKAHKATSIPVLRKDFIIDAAQIYEARAYGADAILVIASILGPYQIREYIHIAKSIGMDSVAECRSPGELEKALDAGAEIIGINNRNLENGSIDIGTTLELLPYVPKGKSVITESGILTHEDVKKISRPGINAMLVGEGIISEELNPTSFDMKNRIYELLHRA